MKKIYRRHSKEFQKKVVDYSLSTSKSIKQICREYNITASQFYSWKKKVLGVTDAEGECVSKEASLLELANEIRRLRKELAKSQRREEIIKKALLILDNGPRRNMSSSK